MWGREAGSASDTFAASSEGSTTAGVWMEGRGARHRGLRPGTRVWGCGVLRGVGGCRTAPRTVPGTSGSLPSGLSAQRDVKTRAWTRAPGPRPGRHQAAGAGGRGQAAGRKGRPSGSRGRVPGRRRGPAETAGVWEPRRACADVRAASGVSGEQAPAHRRPRTRLERLQDTPDGQARRRWSHPRARSAPPEPDRWAPAQGGPAHSPAPPLQRGACSGRRGRGRGQGAERHHVGKHAHVERRQSAEGRWPLAALGLRPPGRPEDRALGGSGRARAA